jgi:hypothetical protein
MLKEDCQKVIKIPMGDYVCPKCFSVVKVPWVILVHGGRMYYCKECKCVLSFPKRNFYVKKKVYEITEVINKLAKLKKVLGVLK